MMGICSRECSTAYCCSVLMLLAQLFGMLGLLPEIEVFDGIAGVAVDFAIDGARGLLDDMHGRVLRTGGAAFVAQFRAELATTVFRLIVNEPNLFRVRTDAVRNFFPESLVERVLMEIVVGRLLVVPRWDLAFLGIAGNLLLGERAHQVRLTL